MEERDSAQIKTAVVAKSDIADTTKVNASQEPDVAQSSKTEAPIDDGEPHKLVGSSIDAPTDQDVEGQSHTTSQAEGAKPVMTDATPAKFESLQGSQSSQGTTEASKASPDDGTKGADEHAQVPHDQNVSQIEDPVGINEDGTKSANREDELSVADPADSTKEYDAVSKEAQEGLTELKISEQEAEPSSSLSTGSKELPGPPTPLKGMEDQEKDGSKDDVMAVAKAFGVPASGDAPQESEKTPLSPQPGLTSPGPIPDTPSAKTGGLRIGKGPPPTTQASEEKPFDFNRFLDQMRHRSAGPVGEYVRSFIKGFTKKPYRVADQTKLIFDFLDFIAQRMRECDVWANATPSEMENAIEAMEKLIMNRLYNFTFSPAIKREGKWSVQTDDLERDRVLKQRIRLFGWIKEEHLDVPVGDHSKGFVDFAIQELHKINHYKAPRDKVICILNCCKVIFGLIRHLSTEENADTFIPILIFVVLRANVDNLISNVEYISRFRNPERLSSESGYYLSSLMGAIAFIETMDYTSLSNITQQEFEANVEAAVQHLSAQNELFDASPARGGEAKSAPAALRTGQEASFAGFDSAQMTPQGSVSSNEEGARPVPISAGAAAIAENTKAFIQRTGEAARFGIGASLGGSMNALGRLFQDGLDGPRTPSGLSPAPVSGRATPDSPTPVTGVTAASASSTTAAGGPSARSRMWNLFGVDEDQMQQPQPQPPKGNWTGRIPSGSSLNFGSWGRNMRADAEPEPLTPQSEELRQGRFATLTEEGLQAQQRQPLAGRLAQSFESRAMPRTPANINVNNDKSSSISPPPVPGLAVRRESVDPYMMQDEEGTGGVRTPTDDGSDIERPSPQAGARARSRFSDFGSLFPNFSAEAAQQQNDRQANRNAATAAIGTTPVRATDSLQNAFESPAQLDDEQAAQAASQIDRAHVDAGVEALKSIFPDMENSVCRLVLEGCEGNVQAAIDKLLEMS